MVLSVWRRQFGRIGTRYCVVLCWLQDALGTTDFQRSVRNSAAQLVSGSGLRPKYSTSSKVILYRSPTLIRIAFPGSIVLLVVYIYMFESELGVDATHQLDNIDDGTSSVCRARISNKRGVEKHSSDNFSRRGIIIL